MKHYKQLTVIGTSHIAGYSVDGKAKATSMSVQALNRFFKLGLGDWYAGELPGPECDRVSIDGTGKTIQDIVSEVVIQTYDISRDDKALRADPALFEKLRAGYPVRREAAAYTVGLLNDEPGAGHVLEALGFQVPGDH